MRYLLLFFNLLSACFGINVPDFGTLKLVASGGDYPTNGSYVLTADIDASSGAFTPIGTFTGTFDGDGHSITGLNIATTGATRNCGMFARPGATAIIKNVVFVDPVILCTSDSADNNIHVGVVAGETVGSNGSNAGCLLENITVINPTVTADTTVDIALIVGIIAGSSHSGILNCTVVGGSVKAKKTAATATASISCGGIVGNLSGPTGEVSETYFGYCKNSTSSALVGSVDATGVTAALYGGITGTLSTNAVGNKNPNCIENCHFTGSINVSSSATDKSFYVGGIVGVSGFAVNAITNCSSTGSITFSSANVYASGGRDRVGGIVSYQAGPATYCFSNIAFNVNYVDAMIIGGGIGGLNGAAAIATDCYATGSFYDAKTSSASVSFTYCGGFVGVAGTGTTTRCWAAMSYSGKTAGTHGGFGGLLASSTETGCFWDKTTSGITAANADATGETTAQMKTLSTFVAAGWDFTNETANGTNDYWRMCMNNADYPRLNWESIDGDFACPDGVNIEDLDYFVQRWLLTNCTSCNNYCGGADMDSSGTVNIADLVIFAQQWLEGM